MLASGERPVLAGEGLVARSIRNGGLFSGVNASSSPSQEAERPLGCLSLGPNCGDHRHERQSVDRETPSRAEERIRDTAYGRLPGLSRRAIPR